MVHCDSMNTIWFRAIFLVCNIKSHLHIGLSLPFITVEQGVRKVQNFQSWLGTVFPNMFLIASFLQGRITGKEKNCALYNNTYEVIHKLATSGCIHWANRKDRKITRWYEWKVPSNQCHSDSVISHLFSQMGCHSALFLSFHFKNYFKFCRISPIHSTSGIRDKKPIMSKNGRCMENDDASHHVPLNELSKWGQGLPGWVEVSPVPFSVLPWKRQRSWTRQFGTSLSYWVALERTG